jgi:adenosylmethionine-8-amino-7-oxononanoate aminotransferase
MSNLQERDQAVVWHPFTHTKSPFPPIGIVRGEGALLYDEQGNEYIDGIASWWMNVHGHAHPHIARRIYEQALTLEHVIFAGFTHEPAVQLAEQILAILPPNQAKVFFSDNGSTAVEVALKMCFQYWHNIGTPRTQIIALHNAYHGDTFGAMSVGARSVFNEPFTPFLFDVAFIPVPTTDHNLPDTLYQLDQLLAQGNVAGIILEPLIQGAAGMVMYTPNALEQIMAKCKAANVLIIADEVMTGFGKTGKWWATSHATTPPDIMCLSKGLTGGTMALGLTTCSPKIYDTFYTDDRLKTLFHGHSCTANPLACAAALASLQLFQQPETWQRIHQITTQHQQFAHTLAAHTHIITNIRTLGIILAFDVHTTQQTGYFNNLRDTIWAFFIARKLILRPLGNTIYILPPLCITPAQLNTLYNAILDFLDHLRKSI